MTRHLHLVRHAEVGAAPSDPGLSPCGRRQAQALARRLAGLPISEIHSSPKRRATETAAALRDALPGTRVLHSDHLQDRTPVPADGAVPRLPLRHLEWLSQVPAGERDQAGAAIAAGLKHFTAPGDGSDLVLVTHAFVLASYVTHALDAPAWRWMGLNADNASLTTLALTADGPVLVCFNDTGHLVGLR